MGAQTALFVGPAIAVAYCRLLLIDCRLYLWALRGHCVGSVRWAVVTLHGFEPAA